MSNNTNSKGPKAARESYPFRPNWCSQELHGYQMAADTTSRTGWILLDADETLLDETGGWFDGPLLTGHQALALADLVDAMVRKLKATPAEASGRHPIHNKHRVSYVGDDLVTVGVLRSSCVICVETGVMRSVPSMSARGARGLARQLRAAGRAIVKAEEAKEAGQ